MSDNPPGNGRGAPRRLSINARELALRARSGQTHWKARVMTCSNCGAAVRGDSTIEAFGALYHPYTDDPSLPCGPVAVKPVTGESQPPE